MELEAGYIKLLNNLISNPVCTEMKNRKRSLGPLDSRINAASRDGLYSVLH